MLEDLDLITCYPTSTTKYGTCYPVHDDAGEPWAVEDLLMDSASEEEL